MTETLIEMQQDLEAFVQRRRQVEKELAATSDPDDRVPAVSGVSGKEIGIVQAYFCPSFSITASSRTRLYCRAI